MRVAVFSHAHPRFVKGGGELAAYYLWQGINRMSGHEAWFFGRGHPEFMHKFSSLAMVGERDYLVSGDAGISDLVTSSPVGADSDLASLLLRIKPDVVHFHHYMHLGLELIRLVKNTCPEAKIVMTLHEYIAICRNNGQMIKTDGRLCYAYSPRDCHLCFPDVTPEDIFLRERYIKSYFGLVDHFISPSHFLKDRYQAWGIEELAPVVVIENGLPEGERQPVRVLQADEKRTRFAYFGQINPYKGIDIILEAFASLDKPVFEQVTLDIFGSGLEYWPQEYQEKVRSLIDRCENRVRLHGAYEPEEMPSLLREIDWIVMGSVWWENSPLVIQEAYKYGRPIICPDIGGMAEKVVPGQGGLHYRARDSVSLASVIKRIASDRGLFDRLYESLPEYSSLTDITAQHIGLYQAGAL
jgi:glycosyltransferase involved in cell wall biosynthesis